MLTDDQQKEVDAQVRFKMEQFMDWLKNSSNWDKHNSYNSGLSSQKIEELWNSSQLKKHILTALKKEVLMATPSDHQYEFERSVLKNNVVQKIHEKYIDKTRGFDRHPELFVRFVVSQVERMM